MLKRLFRGVLVTALSLAAYYSPIKPVEAEEPVAVEYVVQEGDFFSKIAKNRLKTDNLSLIIEETDRLAELNNKGSLSDFPWHENYDCSTAVQEDPNCIYPSENLTLEKNNTSTETNPDYIPFILAGLAGIVGMGLGRGEPPLSSPDLDHIVEIKNNNPYATIDSLVVKSNVENEQELQKNYSDHFTAYQAGKTNLKFARYDSNIAPKDMKQEMVEAYQNSEKSLKAIAIELSDKYGMNISSSTISKYSRQELNVKNRKEAKANF